VSSGIQNRARPDHAISHRAKSALTPTMADVTKMRYPLTSAGYVRVSTDEQDPDSQIKILRDAGIHPDLIFSDVGISGTRAPGDRPAYRRLLKVLEAGEIKDLYVSELSRLGRDTISTLEEMIRLNRAGVTVHSLSTNERVIEEAGPEFKPLLISALQLAADLERKHLSERTKAGMEAARARGAKPGRPEVKIPVEKIREFMDRGLSERSAVLASGTKLSTYYRKKKKDS
jgi:DNA invertase Pin-like site-specific DNA recombinase